MAYIGKEPIVGNFQKCDAISVVNGQAAYTLQVSSTNVVPESANHMLVSLNGILQAPVTSFTVSGSTLTFASNLATGDVIDFVILLGNVLDLGTPSDGTVTNAKLAQDIISGETELAVAPAATDEFLVSDAGVLKRVDASLVGKGKILQVVQGSTNTQTDIASTSYTDTTVTANITCAATSSKVLVLANIQSDLYRNSNNAIFAGYQLVRDTTSVYQIYDAIGIQAGTGSSGWTEIYSSTLVSYLDSPSSTSALTYKIQGKINDTGNSSNLRCQSNNDTSTISTITLIEVGA